MKKSLIRYDKCIKKIKIHELKKIEKIIFEKMKNIIFLYTLIVPYSAFFFNFLSLLL